MSAANAGAAVRKSYAVSETKVLRGTHSLVLLLESKNGAPGTGVMSLLQVNRGKTTKKTYSCSQITKIDKEDAQSKHVTFHIIREGKGIKAKKLTFKSVHEKDAFLALLYSICPDADPTQNITIVKANSLHPPDKDPAEIAPSPNSVSASSSPSVTPRAFTPLQSNSNLAPRSHANSRRQSRISTGHSVTFLTSASNDPLFCVCAEAEIAALLEKLCLDDSNITCADCDATHPQWASANIGVLLCTQCSGVHRSMGVHISFVRSLTMDKWDSAAVAAMKTNKEVNADLEYHVPEHYPKPTSATSREYREKYIHSKYKESLFSKSNNADKPVLLPVFAVEEKGASGEDERGEMKASGNASNGVQISHPHNEGMVLTHGILFITLIEGKGLAKMDVIGTADPFCIFSNGRQSVKSKTVFNSQHPDWHREELTLCMESLEKPLILKMYDVDPFRNEYMGGAEIDLVKLNLGSEKTDMWIKLDSQGSVHVEMAYQHLL